MTRRSYKLLIILIAMVLFIVPATFTYAVVSPMTIALDGTNVNFTTDSGHPFLDEKNRTQVPFRVTMEAFGAKVLWNPLTMTATAQKGDITVEVPVNQTYIVRNGLKIDNDTKAQIVEGRTYLPIRAVLKAFGAYVNWNDLHNRVEVTTNPLSKPVATIEMATGEKLIVMLEPSLAPNTVNNFIALVEKEFYNGLTFHRVIKGFMIQGGCPKGDGTGNPGYSISGEFSDNRFNNPLSHTEGVISMARSAVPDSAGSQFFIMDAPSLYLDGQYAAFGKVVEGLDKVHLLAKTKTDSRDQPLSPLVIQKVTVDIFGVDYPEPIKRTNP